MNLVSSKPVRLISSGLRGQRRTKEVKEGETEEGGEEKKNKGEEDD